MAWGVKVRGILCEGSIDSYNYYNTNSKCYPSPSLYLLYLNLCIRRETYFCKRRVYRKMYYVRKIYFIYIKTIECISKCVKYKIFKRYDRLQGATAVGLHQLPGREHQPALWCEVRGCPQQILIHYLYFNTREYLEKIRCRRHRMTPENRFCNRDWPMVCDREVTLGRPTRVLITIFIGWLSMKTKSLLPAMNILIFFDVTLTRILDDLNEVEGGSAGSTAYWRVSVTSLRQSNILLKIIDGQVRLVR